MGNGFGGAGVAISHVGKKCTTFIIFKLQTSSWKLEQCFSPEHSPPVLTPAPSSGSSIGVVGGHSDHNWSVFSSGNELVIPGNLILIHNNDRHWGDL